VIPKGRIINIARFAPMTATNIDTAGLPAAQKPARSKGRLAVNRFILVKKA
jgi:hypothetical protein